MPCGSRAGAFSSSSCFGKVGDLEPQRETVFGGATRSPIRVSLASAAALAAISMGIIWPGIIAATPLRGMAQPLPAPVLAEAVAHGARAPAIAAMSAWRDLSASAGSPTPACCSRSPRLPSMPDQACCRRRLRRFSRS